MSLGFWGLVELLATNPPGTSQQSQRIYPPENPTQEMPESVAKKAPPNDSVARAFIVVSSRPVCIARQRAGALSQTTSIWI